MKTKNNISILSIVSVLCAAVVVPSYAASSVRALGGAGTYNSASSAASAKASGAENTARAGSLRVGGTTGGTRSSSTRGSSAPRLSIGKYLGGSSVVSGGSSLRPGQSGSGTGGGVSGNNGKLQERVEALEQFVGFSESGTQIKDSVADLDLTVAGLKLDVENLQKDLSDITGKVTTVEFADGVLTIKQDDKTVTDVELATVADLQAAVDSIVIPSLDGYAKLTDIEAMGFLTTDDLAKTQDAIDALRAVDKAMDSAIKSLQGGAITEGVLNAKVAELVAVDTQLNLAIEDLKAKVPADGSFAGKSYVDGLIAELRTADSNLDSAIKAIKQPDVDKKYVDDAVAALNASIAALDSADSTMNGLITALSEKYEKAATKEDLAELQEKIDDITAGDIDLTNYYTKAEADGIFAAKSDLTALQNSIDANAETISEHTDAITGLDTAVKDAADAAADAMIAAQTAQNQADLNADDIKDLQDAGYITSAALEPYAKSESLSKVATTGLYGDLIDLPTIPTSISELTGADVLVNQTMLQKLRDELVVEIGKKQQAGDYATADALQVVSDELESLKNDSYTKAEIDKKITDAVTNGQVSLDGYATTAALTEMETALTALIDKKVNADALGDLAYKNMSDISVGAAQITSIDGSVIQQGTITAEKIDTGDVPSGEMALLVVGEDGQHSWVSITVDETETAGNN